MDDITTERKSRVARAITRLVEDPEAQRLLDSVATVVRVYEVNPLPEDMAICVALALSEPVAYQNLIYVAERKRAERGLPPLVPPPEAEKFDKTEFQREFMAAKRARQTRAAQIENDSRPERDRLIGRARLEFMDAQAAGWKRELDALVAKAREAHGGGRLPKDVMTTLRKQFWAGVDARLDTLEDQVRRRKL